ncbi:MAG: hypothetical protein D4R70_04950 [Betaproteobacteria bacterium]|nr:MAG: hypothetical protein D4R70_04950 [Betaproteobacteria bacterium]
MGAAHLQNAWREERRSAWLYRIVAAAEIGSTRHGLFLDLARAADAQAELWLAEIAKVGGSPPSPYRVDSRARVVGALTLRLGVRRMRPILAAMKIRGMSLYTAEHPHHLPVHVNEVGKRHAVPGGGNLRAAVFGVNDGLISNASLILGVAGATTDTATVLLAGTAGLLAGAFSMAAGEFVSVRAQREFYEYQIDLEREELAQYPQEEAAELVLIYLAKGIPRETAEAMAAQLIADPEKALDTLAREELGLNPGDLGSPLGATVTSFVSFALGAAIPLLPYLVWSDAVALRGTIIATAISLFVVGASISLFTGQRGIAGGARMLAIGGAAGAATWLIGHFLGVSLG